MKKYLILLPILAVVLFACEELPEVTPEDLSCSPIANDQSNIHPKASDYQAILESQNVQSLVGGMMYISDEDGYWQSAWGQASIEQNVPMQTCHRFLIASISKVFTATVVHRLVDEGLWKLEDPISQYLDADTISKIANADKATLSQLLAHTSGIKDYYTTEYELARLNNVNNEWTQEDVLSFVFGKSAEFELGSTYGYSNTNYVLLAILAERVSGKKMAQLYDDFIFTPLGLESGYYSGFDQPIPQGTASGYGQLHKEGLIGSQSLYQDELKTGDGGIAINAWDLAQFYRGLDEGRLLSPESFEAMSTWFDTPEDYHDDVFYQTKNGFGLEYFDFPTGYAWGHTGSVDGFLSIALFFPETKRTIIILSNEASVQEGRIDTFQEVMKEMFGE